MCDDIPQPLTIEELREIANTHLRITCEAGDLVYMTFEQLWLIHKLTGPIHDNWMQGPIRMSIE